MRRTHHTPSDRPRQALPAAVALAMLAALAPVSLAQEEGPPPPPPGWRGPASPERALDRLTRDLDLSEEQREQVRPILEDHFAEVQALREELGPPEDPEVRAEYRARMDEMRARHDERLAEVLTPEQLKEHQRLRMEREARWREHRHERWRDERAPGHRRGRAPETR